MTVEERLAGMMRCGGWERCKAPVCGLDAWAEGYQYSHEKVCPLILDHLEGRDFPEKSAIATNEPK